MTQPASHDQSVSLDDIRTYVINLRRRPDRRAQMTATLPIELRATFTSDWEGSFDGRALTRAHLAAAGYRLFPWRIESENGWWSRPLKYGEIGCTLSHLAVWRHAATQGAKYALVLEDDARIPEGFCEDLLSALQVLRGAFDLLYLGRYPLEVDREFCPGVVVPGYSHCTFGYLLTEDALTTLLAQDLHRAIVPVDEFLPALYVDHPRADLRARFPRHLRALALEPPLVHQRPKAEAGSDTEDSDFAEDATTALANGESTPANVAPATPPLGS